MSELPLHSVALYNPHLLSGDELVGLFAVRRNLLARLLADLSSEVDGVPQSHLIVGQRGMGKTMLLRRLSYAIERDQERSQYWIPLTFPEEQYDVGHLSGLWLNCVDALGDAFERQGLNQEAQRLDNSLATLPNDEDARCAAALDLLVSSSRDCGRRLVLLVDNVDLIFERIKEQQWLFRETLSTTPELVLIGASAQALEASFQYDQSFYEFFRVHELAGLNLDETRALLLHYADRLGADAVRAVVEGEPGRIKALHTLTAGNPRTLVLLFQLLDQGTEGNVRTDLERLLDHSTPLYKARLEALAPQAQRVVHGLAIHWHPATAAMLAKELGLEVNVVSSQLNRLVQQGVVQKEAFDPPSRIGFRLAERFFNIWYLMRTSRRVRRRLIWLVEFLRILYRPEELHKQAQNRLIGLSRSDVGKFSLFEAEYNLALAQAVEDRSLGSALESAGIEELLSDRSLRHHLDELIGSDIAEPLRSRAEVMRVMRDARELVMAAEVDDPDWDASEFWSVFGGSPLLDASRKLDFAEKLRLAGLPGQQEKLHALHGLLERQFQKWVDGVGRPNTSALYQAISTGSMSGPDDLEGAAVARIRLRHDGLELVTASFALERDFNEQAASVLEREVNRLQPKQAYPWFVWGNLLQEQLGRYAEAEAAYRRAIELVPTHGNAWYNLGILLYLHLGRPEESESAFRRATECDLKDEFAYATLASVLFFLGKKIDEAESAARRALDLAPGSFEVIRVAAMIFARRDLWDEARDLAHRFLSEGDEDFLTASFDVIVLFFREAAQTGHAEDAVALLDETGFGERWLPLRAALATIAEGRRAHLRRLAPEVREPAEELLERLVGDDWDGGPV